LANWRIGEVANWRIGELANWRIGELANWRIGELANWRTLAERLPQFRRICQNFFNRFTALHKKGSRKERQGDAKTAKC
jgi:hypothetical protein